MWRRLQNLFSGFLSLFVSGIERANPKALIEAEKENLRRQIARFNDNLATHAGFVERLMRQVKSLEKQDQDLAAKAAAHAGTPATEHLDTLGRPFLTLAHNGFRPDAAPIRHATRVRLDIEGNQREVTDALDRVVMRYDYDMLGQRLHEASMEAGARWTLNDVAGSWSHNCRL